MDPITAALGKHYSEKFALYGPTSEGVDWGRDTARARLRYDKMLVVLGSTAGRDTTLLDVGCGYGGLLSHIAERGIELFYTGIDVAENMIAWAAANIGTGRFLLGDVLEHEFEGAFDYVVCNGILTQKLDTPGSDMDRYAGALIRRIFALSRRGAAFNVMTTKCNYFSNNLYYRNPAELMSWCLSEITPHVVIDHSYPLFEYTVYLYREAVLPQVPEDAR